MRILFLVILSFYFFSCCNCEEKTNTRTLNLINKIGVISIDLSSEFDTLHFWQRISDFHCGDESYYRFQSSLYPLVQEKSYFAPEPDSMYCLTITHLLHPECTDGEIRFEPYKSLNLMKGRYSDGFPLQKFSISEVKKINSLDFAIIAFEDTSFPENVISNNLYATTYYNNYHIYFHFCETSPSNNNSAFIKNSYKMLQTVRINKYR